MSCGNNCAGCKCSGDVKKTPEEINAYYDGLCDGATMYAWWKDGVQYVGTTGRVLADALMKIEDERAKALAK